MEKESAKSNSKKHFFNKKAAIPLFIIIISLAIIGLIGYKVITETGLYNKEVMLSGNPECIPDISGTGCECNDGIDNDGDGYIDSNEDFIDCDFFNPYHDEECVADNILFRMNNYTNAHASVYTSTNFLPYSSCFSPRATYATNKDCTCNGGQACDPNETPENLVVRISSSENGHVELKTASVYMGIGTNVCLKQFNCEGMVGSCSSDRYCIASVEPVDPSTPDTNLHVGNCSSYQEKICCRDVTAFIMNSSGDEIPSRSGRQVMKDSTHTLSVIPENLPQPQSQVISHQFSYSKNDVVTIIGNGSGQEIPPVSYTFNDPTGTIYNYFMLNVVFTDGSQLSHKTDFVGVVEQECRNGRFEPYGPTPEECDDGNNNAEDGCSPTCTIEQGWVCTRIYGNLSVCVQCGNDICEFPIENHQNCQLDCSTYCSDGIIQTLNSEGIPEQCDDQNNINGDGCDRNCQIESGWDCNNQPSFCTFCGDNEVEGNEQCDPPESTGSCSTTQGYQGTQNCNATCQWGACTTNQFCGDNIINGNEECDDGNVNSCDDCSGQCRNEFGFCGDNECCYDFPNRTTETPENCFTDCGVSSFLTGTKISISNNKEEKIENIKTEDLVLSFNEKTNFLTKSKVLQVFKHDADSYYVINGKIKVTAKHPIWTNGKWKKVSELKIGNALMTKDKIYQLIYSISYAEEKIKVYNLKVEDTQTYFAEGILVHNKPPIEIEPQPTTEIPNIGIEQQEGNIPQGKIVLGEGGEFGLSPPKAQPIHPIDKLITWAMNSIKELFGK